MKKKRLIPFNWIPGHWGLSGESKKIAEAEYYYDGKELESELIKIKWQDTPYYDEKILEFEKKWGMISEEKYLKGKADLTLSGKDLELELLEIDYKFNNVTQNEYDKKKATIEGESWVNVISIESGNEGDPGSIELDWNEKFIEELEEAGFKGKTDEDIANNWLTNLARHIALDEFGGVGEFDEELEEADYIRKSKIDDDHWEIK